MSLSSPSVQAEIGQGDVSRPSTDEHAKQTTTPTNNESENIPISNTNISSISSAQLVRSDSDSDDDRPSPSDVLYENRPEWADITPLPLVSGSVMPIVYSDIFKSVFGYLRAVVAAGEMSERAVKLCEDAARLNAANYTVWMYRRKVLAHLQSDLTAEMKYISAVIRTHPKNYQVWYHRQKIVEILKDPSDEFKFTEEILQRDAKNYHAWQHRQFVLKHFQILQSEELAFTQKLIKNDAFNNSAWMHRFFVLDDLPKSCGKKSLLETDLLAREIRFTLDQISEQVHNESPWSYLRGLLRDQWQLSYAVVSAFCEKLYEEKMRSPFLLSFMVEMFEEDISQGHHARTTEEKLILLNRVEDICKALADEHDVIRKSYWSWIRQKIHAKYSPLVLQSPVNEAPD